MKSVRNADSPRSSRLLRPQLAEKPKREEDVHGHRPRVAILHNFPTPYRVELFERLLSDDNLEVMIAFTGLPRENRPTWPSRIKSRDHRIRFLTGIGIPIYGRTEDRVFLNFGLDEVFRWKPDVILLYGFNDPTNVLISLLCVRRRIPYVLFTEISYRWNTGVAARVLRPLISYIVRHATHLAPASKSASAFFRRMGADEDSLTIVPCVPDIQRLTDIGKKHRLIKDELRKEFAIEGKFVVLFVGRLQPYKGIMELLEGIDLISKEVPDVLLLIVGTGPLNDIVRQKCQRNPAHSRFLSTVDEATLHKLYSVSDLHVMPSWSEAYGVVCAEALAFGVPSVVTRSSGCSDLVIDGVNGFLIDSGSPLSIAQAIKKAYDDPSRLTAMSNAAEEEIKKANMDAVADSVKGIVRMAVTRDPD